jgi:hypothetical protein
MFLYACANKFIGVRPTHEAIQEVWYGISQDDVEWVITKCVVCALNTANKGKAVVKPIETRYILDRVELDLIDFRSLADGLMKWILQLKDTFSRHIWLYALEDKEAEHVYDVVKVWVGQNGNPWAFGCDNGREFKGFSSLILSYFNVLTIS